LADLIHAIHAECNRVRRAMREYQAEIPNGSLAGDVLHGIIKEGEDSIASGDQARILKALASLRGVVPWHQETPAKKVGAN
jgi:hypothetical protein